MESAGKRRMSILASEAVAEGYVYLPVSYTEQLADGYPCPNLDENLLGPSDIRRILKSAPGVEDKLAALGLSCQVDEYEAMYVIPANEIPAQDVRVMEGSIHLAPKAHPGLLLKNCGGGPGPVQNEELNPLQNRVASLGVTVNRLETAFDNTKKLMQATAKKAHKVHLQVPPNINMIPTTICGVLVFLEFVKILYSGHTNYCISCHQFYVSCSKQVNCRPLVSCCQHEL